MGFYTDKIAIITGAGSGIGYALGKKLGEKGAVVILADIKGDRCQALAEQLIAAGCRAEAASLDVSDPTSVQNLVRATAERYGRLDYIFNNAGIAVGGEVRDISLEDWHDVLNVNLNGVINGVAAAYPLMVKQGFGHIVNTGSIEGLVPFPNTVPYVASKYAVVGLSNGLRLEGADLGVKVSVVCPGYVKTAIFHVSKLVNIDRQKTIEELESFGGVTPEECAEVMLTGVQRNQAIITVTRAARIIWWLHRLMPRLIMAFQERRFRKIRQQIRTVP